MSTRLRKYLEEDFIQEFGINLIIIHSLSKINKSEYPEEKAKTED